MRLNHGRRVVGTLGCVVLSQSVWAGGPVPGGLIVPLVLGQQARRVSAPEAQERPLLLPAPGTTPALSTSTPTPATRYRVRCGDSLEIKVMGRPELTQAVTVAPDGTIIYPYVGEVEIAGETLSQVTTKLKIGLKRQLENPIVLVNIVKRQMGSVSILGPVREPGKRELGDDWHVLNLLSDAKGMTLDPELVTMRLVRKGGQNTLTVDPVQVFSDPKLNYALEDGDLLVIQERSKSETMVSVLGEVGKPGYVVCPRDGSPLAALVAAGGAGPKAALSRATLRRGTGGTPITMDLSNPETIPQNLTLGPGDTLTIPANARQIFITGGGVLKPGTLELPDNIQPTLYWAVQQAGGTSQNADLKKVRVTRLAPNGTPISTLIDLEKVLLNQTSKGQNAEEVSKLNQILRPGDTLDIPLKGEKRRGFHFGLNEFMMGTSTFLMIRQLGK